MVCIPAFQHATREDRSEGVRTWPGPELLENPRWTASLGVLLALKPASHALASFASSGVSAGMLGSAGSGEGFCEYALAA